MNEFLPAGLPLLSDYSLFRTVIEYESMLSMLSRSNARSANDLTDRIIDALTAVEIELKKRGLDHLCRSKVAA